MNRPSTAKAAAIILTTTAVATAAGKPPKPYPLEPGDPAVHDYLARLAVRMDERFTETLPAADAWESIRAAWKTEYLYMLGLDPLPEKTPLNVLITGTLQRDGYVVEKLCFQSRPRLYVTANLYRPVDVPAGAKLPAVLYVCGHGHRGPEGVKIGYQSHPIWFARHGYVCLIVDTLERGEIKSVHHGLYREGRHWWLSRGYTPAGVETWNGIRAIDYLVSRPDVDATRIAVTGISGGGATSFWIAAADERVTAAVPISGMSDLRQYVGGNGVDRHCDCMFMPNTFAWPWTRIAALVAPRPVLFVNSDADALFPLDGDERVINRLERIYGILGAGDLVDSVVSVGGHAYRKDIRQATCRFINTHLKNDPAIVTDSERDLPVEENEKRTYPIEPADLCVFPDGVGLPANPINATIDEHFVPMAQVDPPATGKFVPWKQRLLAELRRVTFRAMPEQVQAAKKLRDADPRRMAMSSEEGIEFRLLMPRDDRSSSKRIILLVSLDPAADPDRPPDWLREALTADETVEVCLPRGVGDTRWNTQSPPNRIERQFALVGRTVDSGRVRDVIAAALYLSARRPNAEMVVAGENAAGVIAAYAALLEPTIDAAIVRDPPVSHMDPGAPQLLNVLRVCDVPDVLGMLAPRRLTIDGAPVEVRSKVRTVYAAAGAPDALVVR